MSDDCVEECFQDCLEKKGVIAPSFVDFLQKIVDKQKQELKQIEQMHIRVSA